MITSPVQQDAESKVCLAYPSLACFPSSHHPRSNSAMLLRILCLLLLLQIQFLDLTRIHMHLWDCSPMLQQKQLFSVVHLGQLALPAASVSFY